MNKDRKLAEANDLLLRKEYDSAIAIYSRIIDKYPELADIIDFNKQLALRRRAYLFQKEPFRTHVEALNTLFLKKVDEFFLSKNESPKISKFPELYKLNQAISPSGISNKLRNEILREVEARNFKVSVIIPTWNREKYVVDAIESAINQSVSPFEVLIYDDLSDDNTLQTIKSKYKVEIENKRILLLEGKVKKGVCFARNQALQASKGDVIAYLDSDNEWHKDHLLYALYSLMVQGSDSSYTGVGVIKWHEQKFDLLYKEFNRLNLLKGNFIDLNSYIHKVSLYKDLGGFDESLTRLVDWELIIRFTKSKLVSGIPIVTVKYNLDKNNLNNITFTENLNSNIDRIIFKHMDEYKNKNLLSNNRIESLKKQFNNYPVPQKGNEPVVVVYKEILPSRLKDILSFIDLPIILYELTDKNELCTREGVEVDLNQIEGKVVWFPDLSFDFPDHNQLRSLFLSSICSHKIDFGFLNYDFNFSGTLKAQSLRNQMVFSAQNFFNWLDGRNFNKINHIKVHNAPEAKDKVTNQIDLKKFIGKYKCIDTSSDFNFESIPLVPIEKHKKNIFIFPMKVAVGGVERNTIEVMRALRNDYNFIYITMEKIKEQNGTLGSQVSDVAYRFIDMCEVTEHKNYISFLRMLKKIYRPELIWVCNGSMWFCENADRIRSEFDDIPIVDQQVYDVKEGWIRRYREKGVQSFDRFIAINQKIYNRFIADFSMDKGKIDLIYSSIDKDKFKSFKVDRGSRSQLLKEYRVPENKKLYSFMGRLVDQKNPFAFLQLAKYRKSIKDEFFIMVGDGALREDVRYWMDSNDTSNLVWIKNIKDTRYFWSIVDGLVVCSNYEGLPIAMIEALSMGVPVYSTDVGDIKAVIKEHKAGYVIENAQNIETFHEGFSYFVERIDNYKNRLISERHKILDRFSSERILNDYKACFESAMEGYTN